MKSKNISKNIKGQNQNITGKRNQNQKLNINNISPKKQISINSKNYNYNNKINNNNNKSNQKIKNNNINQKNQINAYSYNPNKNNIKIINNKNNQLNNNNIYNNNNSKNKVQSKSAVKYINSNKQNNNIKKISPPKIKDYQFIEFHPYTLKDYKELMRNPVVLGKLGPNVGTKEWEEKKQKMKKMMNYSNNVNKEHKGIKTLKKDTPKDEVEKLIKEKIEKSARFKTYEYGKLLRTGKYKEDFDTKEFNKLNKSNERNLNVIQENEINNNNYSYEENNNNDLTNNNMSYEDLMKQNEELKTNIEDIREHILD